MVLLAAAGIESVMRLSSSSCRQSLDVRIAAFAAAFAAAMVWVCLTFTLYCHSKNDPLALRINSKIHCFADC